MCDVKYIPYANEYIAKAHGDGYEHLKRWLKRRMIFCDTLFDYSPSYTNDVLTIRANTTETMTLEIETYSPVYQHLSWYNNQMDKKKIDGKTSVVFTGKAQAATDQEVLIYGGSNIKSIKGISTMNPNQMLIGSATRLTELEATNCPLLTDINSNKANLSPHTYLNKVDLSGCGQLGGALRLNNSPLIRDINMKGTVITSVQMPTSVRNLEVLRLPNTITSLTLQDASLLNTLEFDEGMALQSILLTNCNNLTNTINFDLTQTPTVYLDNSYNGEELYMSATTNLTLRNMSNLERVIYTPNDECETFDMNDIINGRNYEIHTFNNPKMTTFMTTAPHRVSYKNGEYGDIAPNTVFTANTLDLSYTQFTDIKFLCTTDLYNLKVPTTMKNFYCDSAMDIDTEVVTDASYEVVHDELVEQYTTNYESEVYRYEEKYAEGYSIPQSNWLEGHQLANGEIASQSVARVSDFFPVSPNTSFTAVSTGIKISQVPYTGVSFYDENKNHIEYFGLQLSRTVPSNGRYARISLSTEIAIDEFTINYTGVIPRTPNIIPSSASGSLIFNMYSNNTTQPTSTSPYMWDLTGLKLNDFYTFGMNNWVKASDDSIVLLNRNEELTYCYGNYSANNTTKGALYTPTGLTNKCLGWLRIPKGNHVMRTSNGTGVTPCWWDDTNGMMRTPGFFYIDGRSYNWNDTRVTTDYYECYLTIDNQAEWVMVDDVKFDLTSISSKGIDGVTNDTVIISDLGDLVVYDEGCDVILDGTPTSITTPQRLPGYSVRMVNADITPNNYANHLYPLLVDTTLPITGRLDYSTYNGTSLAWAYAYTTNGVGITPLGSQNQSNITNDYNKLYGTDYVDIVDVWAYKDDDFSTKSTNEQITKAYIQLTSNNYTGRIDEVLQWYPNCTDIYLFDDGSVTNLQFMYSAGGHNNGNGTRLQVQNVTFMEGYFNNLTSLYNAFTNCLNLVTVNNIPKSVTDFKGCFEGCQKLNYQIDLSDYNISAGRLEGIFYNNYELSYTPILPSDYTGTMKCSFLNCRKLVEAPVIPEGVNDLSDCFNACTSLVTAPELSHITSGVGMQRTFQGCTSLTTVPSIPPNAWGYLNTFNNCTSLVSVPESGWRDSMNGCFDGCSLLNQRISIENATSLVSTFRGCSSLTTTPNLPSGVASLQNTFYGCSSLTQAPIIPSNVTNMDSTFRECSSLTTPPNIPDSVTNMNGTFRECSSLTQAPNIPESVTNMNGCFYGCSSLINGAILHEGVGGTTQLYLHCISLETVQYPLPNSNHGGYAVFQGSTGKIKEFTWIGERRTNFDVTRLFDVLGRVDNNVKPKWIQDLVPEHLADLTENGTTATLTLGETYLSFLTEEQIEQATNKGWTLQ